MTIKTNEYPFAIKAEIVAKMKWTEQLHQQIKLPRNITSIETPKNVEGREAKSEG